MRDADEKGILKYSSPPCPKNRKTIVAIVFVILFSVLFTIGLWSLIGVIFFDYPKESIILTVLLIPNSLLAPMSISGSELPLHFRIYENGITRDIHHLSPFSDCNAIQPRKGPRYLAFLKWEQIACFDRFFDKPDTPSVVVYVNEFDSRGFRKLPISYRQKNNESRVVINELIKVLIEHGKNEIPITCPKCNIKLVAPLDHCQNCQSKRF